MKCLAVVPVNHLDRSKSRLAEAEVDRPRLTRQMLDTVLTALTDSPVSEVLVVTADPRLQLSGHRVLVQTRPGLNPALDEAREWACGRARFDALLVCHSDLPRLTAQEVRALLARAPEHGLVLAGDRQRAGTNLLLTRPPELARFQFGPDSYRKHQEWARGQGLEVVDFAAPGTAFDLDTPDHYAEFALEDAWTTSS